MSQRDYDKGAAPGGAPLKKEPPPVYFVEHVNQRTGEVSRVPVGVDPGFGYNPGMGRRQALATAEAAKLRAADDGTEHVDTVWGLGYRLSRPDR